MSLASILLHVDDTPAFGSRMKMAVRLANQFNAHLTALYVVWPNNFTNIAEISPDADIITSHRKTLWEAAEKAQKLCEEAAQTAGVKLDWRAEEGVLIDMINEHGRYCDLIVLGQHDPEDRKNRNESATDHVVLESGTACLVVPYIGTNIERMDNVLIAWNGSMESASAVKDAVPFLKQANRVEILMINLEQAKVEKNGAPAAGVKAYLAKHGVEAETHVIRNKQSNDVDVLLSYASDFAADLVVMGAYGHPRWREKVLGGFTQHLLKHMTVPVLMSH